MPKFKKEQTPNGLVEVCTFYSLKFIPLNLQEVFEELIEYEVFDSLTEVFSYISDNGHKKRIMSLYIIKEYRDGELLFEKEIMRVGHKALKKSGYVSLEKMGEGPPKHLDFDQAHDLFRGFRIWLSGLNDNFDQDDEEIMFHQKEE